MENKRGVCLAGAWKKNNLTRLGGDGLFGKERRNLTDEVIQERVKRLQHARGI